ncbi:MAG TPA: transporter substrate-binding domain-containing protein [Methylomirabilota bacterium]|nr:transporter substrate-binding domain-containing protein [Methylomirabilota bacterium]
MKRRATASEPSAPVARAARKGGAGRIGLCFLVALLASSVVVVPARAADTFRVCADPDNLPFSRAEGAERGLYVELAELVASRLGLRSEYAWFPSNYGRRAVRNTLLADRCDAYFGLPDDGEFMGRSVIRSKPFLDVGYAVIGRRPFAFSSLDDLKGRRVAVQFGTTPQLLLSTRPGFQAVTFRLAEEAMEGLARGEADVAFLWGPVAGYVNKSRLGSAYEVVPVAGEGLQWHAAIGVRKGQDALKADLDRVLDQLQPEIKALADKYGFPLRRPVSIDGQRGMRETPGGGAIQLVQHSESASHPTSPTEAVPSSSVPQAPDSLIRLGRSLFNQHCSHCHAPNAMSAEPTRDLRRLALRYGGKMREVAYATITVGRVEKGMPAWRELLGEEAIQNVLGFLESVQRQP